MKTHQFGMSASGLPDHHPLLENFDFPSPDCDLLTPEDLLALAEEYSRAAQSLMMIAQDIKDGDEDPKP